MLRASMVLTGALVLLSPTTGWAQLGGGVGGIGLQGLNGAGQFGAPPAGVGLHQQYMQLYGLPVNFTQPANQNNGGQQGIFPGGGLGGFGGGGRFFGANYQRQMAAMAYMQRAAMMARYQQQQQAIYGPNAYPTTQPISSNASNYTPASFGMSQSSAQPFFNSTPTAANSEFRGFGLTSSFMAPIPALTTSEEKKEDKQDQKDKK